jgi:hypothetical protein
MVRRKKKTRLIKIAATIGRLAARAEVGAKRAGKAAQKTRKRLGKAAQRARRRLR